MSISLYKLRAALPEHKNQPDDAFVCMLWRETNSKLSQGEFFDYLHLEQRPIFLNCDQVIQLHSMFLPKTLLVGGLTAGLLALLSVFLFKFINKKIPIGSTYSLGLKLVSFDVFVSINLLIAYLFRYDVVTAFTYAFGWFLITFPFLFLSGVVFNVVTNMGLDGIKQVLLTNLNKVFKIRNSKIIWLKVLEELESNSLDKAMWAQSLAKAGGDEVKAKGTYMKARYDQLNVSIK